MGQLETLALQGVSVETISTIKDLYISQGYALILVITITAIFAATIIWRLTR